MKVLWFAPTPCGSVRRYGKKTIGGGWLISLEDELKQVLDISLEVAYISGEDKKSFVFDGVRYHPLYLKKRKNKLAKILDVHRSEKNQEKKLVPQIKRLLEQTDADIIHVHGTESLLSLTIPLVQDKPIVVSIQGLIVPISKKFFSGIPFGKSVFHDSFKDIAFGQGILKVWHKIQYKAKRESIIVPRTAYFFGRTFWDFNVTLALNPHRKYHVVNEIMRPSFYETQWKGNICNNCVEIITVISGAVYKGYEVILETANLLKLHSGIPFKWHIVGYDSKSKWVRISEKFKKIQSSKVNIVFHGRKSAEELAIMLSKCDIYVNTSHIENSPNSVCEAMLIGMPIIASYAGGTASLLQHEKEGVLVQDGDPYVLAGAIINYVQNPEKAILYANNAGKRARKRHDKKSIVRELIEGYQIIIENNN